MKKIGLIGAAVLLTAGGCANSADDGAAEPAMVAASEPVERGRATYATYCSGCHGPTGKGDGAVAPMLGVELRDLATLVERYGEFPAEYVASTIDGRAQVDAHGPREMPVWGNIWFDSEDSVSGERTKQQISELVVFVESLQAATGSATQ